MAVAPTGTVPRRTRVGSVRVLRVTIAVSALPMLVPLFSADDGTPPLVPVAAVLGLLGGLLLWWQTVLGIRQLTRYLTADRAAVVRLHTWLGVTGAMAVLLHPLLWRLAEHQDWPYLWTLDFTWVEGRFVSLGRIAFLLFLLVWLSSTLARYALSYRWWRYLHYLTYPITMLVFIHAHGATGVLAGNTALLAYWWLLTVGLAGALALRLASPLLARPYTLTMHRRAGSRIAFCTATPGQLPLPARPGEFFFVRASRWRRGHPFSVVSTADTGAVHFAVGEAGRFTRTLGTLEPGSIVDVYLDGPYGAFPDNAADSGHEAVFIAGGIGITAFAHQALHTDPERTWLYHLVRDPAELIYDHDLAATLGQRYRPVVSAADGRLTADAVPERLRATATFSVCGSPRFTENWYRQLRGAGVARERIRLEQFE